MRTLTLAAVTGGLFLLAPPALAAESATPTPTETAAAPTAAPATSSPAAKPSVSVKPSAAKPKPAAVAPRVHKAPVVVVVPKAAAKTAVKAAAVAALPLCRIARGATSIDTEEQTVIASFAFTVPDAPCAPSEGALLLFAAKTQPQTRIATGDPVRLTAGASGTLLAQASLARLVALGCVVQPDAVTGDIGTPWETGRLFASGHHVRRVPGSSVERTVPGCEESPSPSPSTSPPTTPPSSPPPTTPPTTRPPAPPASPPAVSAPPAPAAPVPVSQELPRTGLPLSVPVTGAAFVLAGAAVLLAGRISRRRG